MLEKKLVSLVRCADYSRNNVNIAVQRAIDNIGGIEKFVKPGQKVLLKPNILQIAHPDDCVTTHPEIVRAVAELLVNKGCKVLLADSPGSGLLYNTSTLRKAYSANGYDVIAEELGIELNYDISYREVPSPNGKAVKMFQIISPALEADVIISLPKAKTHVMTSMTGAAKNMFGVLPGIEKPSFHSRSRDPARFADMLIDLDELMKPTLHVMDAVIGMEGDGPSGGSPRKIGAIITSADYTALDSHLRTYHGI